MSPAWCYPAVKQIKSSQDKINLSFPKKLRIPKTRAAACQKQGNGTFLVTQKGRKQQMREVEAYLAPEGAGQRGALDKEKGGECREL